ncbi:YcxB family protein [Asanoa sp. NPDC049573]|uniref:YcxB family protein n=1 Tax=Asanoa sp. NPDC049573 TaxID=3155396 RepID=UPI00343B5C97
MEQVTVGPVTLGYTLTEADWVDGLVAHRRGLRRPWLLPLLIVAALVGVLLGHARSGRSSAMTVTDVVVLVAVAVGGVVFGLLLFRFLVRARWIYRWQARLIMRGNPWLSEPIRAVVDGSGLRLTSASRTETAAWSQYLRYVETDRSFVLRASDRAGAAVLVLPKRGLDSGDPAPLRALLEANCDRRA